MTDQVIPEAARREPDIAGKGRSFYLGVSLTALMVIFYETVVFQTLNFVADYMRAIQVIAIALLGIAVGGLLAFALRKRVTYSWYMWVSLSAPVAVAVAFASVCLWPANPWMYSIGLMLPFVAASMVISMTFALAPSHIVYFYDLTGAAAGALVACFSVPNLREEGSFLLIMLVGLAATVVFSLHVPGKRTRLVRNLAAVCATVIACVIISNQFVDYLNMVYLVRKTDEGPAKIYNYCKKPDGTWCDLRFSHGSLVERIDIVKSKKNRAPTFYNGYPNDHISGSGPESFKTDKRLANGLVQNPDTLVIGTAAEGIVKTAKGLGNGAVVGLEINPAIVKAMLGKFYKFSHEAYADMELHVIDARSYFKRTGRKFDIITMMNTHRMRNVGYAGQPEYLHTCEALDDIFDHLTDRGWLVLEEREVNERARYGIRRFIQNVKYVLEDHLRVKNPADHFWVYDWWGRDSRAKGNLYTQIYIKQTPINESDIRFITEYEAARKEKNEWSLTSTFRPDQRSGSDVEKLILAKSPDEVFDPKIYNFERITDDRPFPFDVMRERPHVTMIMKPTVTLTVLFGLIPVVILLGWHGFKTGGFEGSKLRHMIFSGSTIVYFALLGIGYLMIEVVFMQKLQIFLGIPVLTMATVLGSMLFFSGLGSYFSREWKTGLQAAAFAGILGFAFALLASMGWLIDHLTYLPVFVRAPIVVVMLAPLSFLMGTPFPYGMKLIRNRLDDRFAAAMFGLNGAFSALATPLALTMAMIVGYRTTFLAGVGVYAVCLLVAMILAMQARGAKSAKT